MKTDKARPRHFWKDFFQMQGVLILFMGLFTTIYLWRFKQHVPTHPPLGRAFFLGMLVAVGCFLIAMCHRAIHGSSQGMAFSCIFSIQICPINPSGPISYVLCDQVAALFLIAFMLGFFAFLVRRWTWRRSKPAQSPLADAELDARSLWIRHRPGGRAWP